MWNCLNNGNILTGIHNSTIILYLRASRSSQFCGLQLVQTINVHGQWQLTVPCLLKCASVKAHHHTPEQSRGVRISEQLNLVKFCTQ